MRNYNLIAAIVAAFLSGNATLGMEACDAVEVVGGGATPGTITTDEIAELALSLMSKVTSSVSDTSKKFSIQGKLESLFPIFRDFSRTDWENVCALLSDNIELSKLESKLKKKATLESFRKRVTSLETQLASTSSGAADLFKKQEAAIGTLTQEKTSLSAQVNELTALLVARDATLRDSSAIAQASYNACIARDSMITGLQQQIGVLQQQVVQTTANLSARADAAERRAATAEEIVIALRGEVAKSKGLAEAASDTLQSEREAHGIALEKLREEMASEIQALNARLQRFNDFQKDESASVVTGSVGAGGTTPVLELSQVEKDLESIEGLQYLLRVTESAKGAKEKEKSRLLTEIASQLIFVLHRRITEFERGLAKNKRALEEITSKRGTWGALVTDVKQSVVSGTYSLLTFGRGSAYDSPEVTVKIRGEISLSDVQTAYSCKYGIPLDLINFNKALIDELFPESAAKSKAPGGAGGAGAAGGKS